MFRILSGFKNAVTTYSADMISDHACTVTLTSDI